MLDHVGIIHMGGRIFDPAIGRFLSADPVVKGMGSTEAYNRYSYVGNNPMSYTDPTGYFSLGLGIGGRVKREFSRVESRYRYEIRGVLTGGLEPMVRYGGRELARFVQRNKYGGQILGLVTIAGCSVASAGTATAGCVAAVQGFATGSMAYGTGESIEYALRAGTQAAAVAMADGLAAGGIGGLTEGLHPLRAATIGAGLHGMRGATFAAINGYDIRSGLIGGATEGALGGAIADFTPDSRTGQTAIAAMISGTVSEVSGGNFATGAVTGAMGYLFNQLGEWRGRARAASAASLVLDADGGIAMLMDGRRTYDEALQLRNFVMDAPLMDFLGIFPELSNRGLTDIRLIRESMRIDIQAVGIQGLNRMIVGGGGLANDIAIGMSVSAAASVIGVSYQTVALIELSLAAGTSMHQRDHRAPLVDRIREKYIR